jgi:hypothetical protein
LQGKTVKITDINFRELQRLCEEFDFDGFAAQLSEFQLSCDFKKQGMRMHADESQRLKKRQNNTSAPLRCCIPI